MIETISFGDSFPSLQSYEKKNWLLNETRNVEFFKDCFYKVTLISTESPDLQNYLKEIDVQTPIALDLEWENEINSFQFAIQNRVLVIRHPNGPGNKFLYDYLLNHSFFAKGCHNDKIKLKEKFGYNFESNIEDIERTRLQPYGYSLNFIQMTLQFAGNPTTDFKDVRISKSNWDQSFLTIRQVLYAAFDVVAIFQSYKNFPPPKKIVHQKEPKKAQKHENVKTNKPRTISNKRDFNLTQNEWKTDGQKILLKQSISKRIQCYIISNYNGPTDYISTNNILKSIPCENVDHISNFTINGLTFLFISLFLAENSKSEIYFAQLSNLFEKNQIITIPILDPSDSTDNDVIFLSNLPDELKNEDQLNLFLNCFGSDSRFTFDQNFNARIQPHRAQSSLRMKNFIPFMYSNDNQPLMKFSIFPYYLPMIRATFPSSFSTCEEVENFFSECGKVEKVTIFDKKTENDVLTAIVTFSTIEEALNSINKFNYTLIGPSEEEIYVQRYTDENHFRFLRFHELLVNGIKNERDLRKRFEKYGEVLQAKYDRLFQISRVYYIEKKSAILAAQNEKCANLAPLSTMAFIRNLPFTTTDTDIIELTKPFGKVLGFVYRDLVKEMKGLVVEVMFSSHEEAFALKTALHHKKIGNATLEVNASTLEELETPIWKMQQRKRWVTCIARVESPLSEKNNENENENLNVNDYDSYDEEDEDDDDDESDNEFSSTDESNEYNDNYNCDVSNCNDENGSIKNIKNDDIEIDSINNKNNDSIKKSQNSINSNQNDGKNKNVDDDKNKNIDDDKNKNVDDDKNKNVDDDKNKNVDDDKNKNVDDDKNKNVDDDKNKNDPMNNKSNDSIKKIQNSINCNQNDAKNKDITENENDDDSTETYNENRSNIDMKHSNTDSLSNDLSLKNEDSNLVNIEDLIKSCESVGPVIDVKTKTITINDESEITNKINYQKVFILFASPVSTTQVIRRFKQYNIKMSTIGEFVNEILPEQFILRKIDTENLKANSSQPTAIVINDKPSFMDDNCIHKMLFNIRAYEFYIEDNRAIIYTKSKRVAQHIFKTLQSLKSKQFISINILVNAFGNHYSNNQSQSKAKNVPNSNINFDLLKNKSGLLNEKNSNSNDNSNLNESYNFNSTAEENKMKIEMYVWFAVPNRPRFHPFERIISQRKMPIVVDPVPKNTTASEVRAFCDGCGRFDVKVQGSSCEVGKRRAIIQPRNTKAKMSCFEIFKNERFKGEFYSPIRIKKDEIPPPLDENSDDQTEYD